MEVIKSQDINFTLPHIAMQLNKVINIKNM